MTSPSLPQHYLVTVYEVVNETRGEVYLGLTTLLASQLAAEFLKAPPKVVSRWRPEHRVILRCLVYAVPLKEGRAIINRYWERGSRDKRRVLAPSL
jgi:hypothetical protein